MIFVSDNNDWKYLVWNMRQNIDGLQYDWVFGPVADGGIVSSDFKDIKAFGNKNQFAILSKAAVECLELLEVIKC
jgi:hypothetical protein